MGGSSWWDLFWAHNGETVVLILIVFAAALALLLVYLVAQKRR